MGLCNISGYSILILLLIPETLCLLGPSWAGDSTEDYLKAHNEARKEVGLQPLVWDARVAAVAKRYANLRRGSCSLVHSGGPYGENLAWASGELPAGDAVQMWVDEKKDYEYETNTCRAAEDGMCLHYTQVVWRDSVRLGCAKVGCGAGGTFVVCNYDPPGNYIGQKPY